MPFFDGIIPKAAIRKEVELLKQERPVQRIGYFPHPQPPETIDTGKQAPCARISAFRLSALLVCACVFLLSSFLLGRYLYDGILSRKAAESLEKTYDEALAATQTEAAVPVPSAANPQPRAESTPIPAASSLSLWPQTYPDNPTMRVSAVFYQMQRENPDIVAWIQIDDVLEQAVVQRDNQYYLTHNSLGQKSVTGALFLDENCQLDTVPTQTLIHGHNMKDGSMFGGLMKYKTKGADFYHHHAYIDLNTLYENARYVIFAICEVDIRSTQPDYLPFWQDVRFESAERFSSYVERARSLSQLRCSVDVQPGDRLLTLSTCITSDQNKRLLIMARKLRPDEDEFQLNISVLSASDR